MHLLEAYHEAISLKNGFKSLKIEWQECHSCLITKAIALLLPLALVAILQEDIIYNPATAFFAEIVEEYYPSASHKKTQFIISLLSSLLVMYFLLRRSSNMLFNRMQITHPKLKPLMQHFSSPHMWYVFLVLEKQSIQTTFKPLPCPVYASNNIFTALVLLIKLLVLPYFMYTISTEALSISEAVSINIIAIATIFLLLNQEQMLPPLTQVEKQKQFQLIEYVFNELAKNNRNSRRCRISNLNHVNFLAEKDVIVTQHENVAKRYTDNLNTTISVLMFGLGLGCLGTDSPRDFAILSLAYTVILVLYTTSEQREQIQKLRKEGIPTVNRWSMLKSAAPFILGWIFLGFIAFGWIGKTGWVAW